MIFFDTETTGLWDQKTWFARIPPDKRPYMVEIAAIKTDENLKEIDRFTTLVGHSGVKLPPEAKDWYDITDEMLAAAPSFPIVLEKFIRPFWLGETTVVAYNVTFDIGMLYFELFRIEHQFRFPWCHNEIDAIQYRNGKRMRMQDWAKEVQGDRYKAQTHRALDDVEMLLECYRSLR